MSGSASCGPPPARGSSRRCSPRWSSFWKIPRRRDKALAGKDAHAAFLSPVVHCDRRCLGLGAGGAKAAGGEVGRIAVRGGAAPGQPRSGCGFRRADRGPRRRGSAGGPRGHSRKPLSDRICRAARPEAGRPVRENRTVARPRAVQAAKAGAARLAVDGDHRQAGGCGWLAALDARQAVGDAADRAPLEAGWLHSPGRGGPDP